MIRLRYGFFVSAASALLFCSGLAVSCSSETGGQEFGDEEITFPIYAYGSHNTAGDGSRAAQTDAQAADAVLARMAPYGEEDILPVGWNDPLGEAEKQEASSASLAGRKKTSFRYTKNNVMYVSWSAGDQIGIKTRANAQSGGAQWTRLSLDEGVGASMAIFEGIASTTNGLQPTGSQEIVAVCPYKSSGSYDLTSQPGTIADLGDYDIRWDRGELVNGTAKDLYFEPRTAVLRLPIMFFDDGDQTKTVGKSELTVTVKGAGIGSRLSNICASNETVTPSTTAPITATVDVDPVTGWTVEDVYLAFVPVANLANTVFTVEVQSGSDASTYSRYEFSTSGALAAGRTYNVKHPGTNLSEQCIVFEDSGTEGICLKHWDLNGNGCLSYREARAVTEIGTAFAGASSIQKFNEFQYFTNPNLTKITSGAFKACLIKEITLPEQMNTIEFDAFSGCTSLVSVQGGSHVESIGENAFYNCSSLVTADDLLLTATTIGKQAFYKCSSLVTANSPAVTTIGQDAFRECTSLTTANFPALTTISAGAFAKCSSLVTADFPAATTVELEAFTGCSSLVTTDLLPAVTTIGQDAFRGCTSLVTVNLPALTTIGRMAFSACSSLVTADFPSLTYIDNWNGRPFENCKSLRSLYFRNTSGVVEEAVPRQGLGLGLSSSLILYVPEELVLAYKSDFGWQDYRNNIQAIP